jgi:transposase-like protein
MAALSDGSKRVVAVVSGHRESTESWSAVLRDLKGRRMRAPRVVAGDGHLGIWAALHDVFSGVQYADGELQVNQQREAVA